MVHDIVRGLLLTVLCLGGCGAVIAGSLWWRGRAGRFPDPMAAPLGDHANLPEHFRYRKSEDPHA